MAKIKIAQNPTFKAGVLIPIVGNAPEKVEFTFKYRDRAELAALFDDWSEKRDKARAALGDKPTWSKIVATDTEQQAQQIKDLVVGWGFDDEFNEDNIVAFVKSCQGAAEAVVKAHESAYSQARLGN
ncbi:Phage tail assembly chaperone [Pseudomonas sp. ok272]|uniref:phage tail assembly chaperone n=1 Tax=unclassified Pseudomonas TaxID=196821 RepID=UPI0008C5C690|nr:MULTISPECIES: phage tail assembly chaperone [unclassified Pseudomonas]SEM50223.1 Phage tail assembly chaperone [Pseudomonas sp. ok272]SFM21728.1 Phage tail assembly chaperone [Pseudomonas sp. ok602]